MAGGGDEVEHGVDTIVPETRVTLDTRFLGKDIVILPLQVSNDLRKATCSMSACIPEVYNPANLT